MFSIGCSQCAFSVNWKSPFFGSKPVHRKIDSTKVMIDVHSAPHRALRCEAASSPRTKSRIKPAPTKGRNVTSDRRCGRLLITPSPPDRIKVVGHYRSDADQHREGVVIDVTALQLAGLA